MDDTNTIWSLLESVNDPEIPVLSVVDLGIIRAVRLTDDGPEIVITPTYSGCPAMDMIRADIGAALCTTVDSTITGVCASICGAICGSIGELSKDDKEIPN